MAGGNVGWVFAAGAGWPPARRTRVSEIIVRHMWSAVDPAVDVEGHLLELATSLDITGSQQDDWPIELRREIVRRVPGWSWQPSSDSCSHRPGGAVPVSRRCASNATSTIADASARSANGSA